MMSKTISILSLRTGTAVAAFFTLISISVLAGCSDGPQHSTNEEQRKNSSASTQPDVAIFEDTPGTSPAITQTPTSTMAESNTQSENIDDRKRRTLERRTLGRRSFLQCRACHTLKEGEAHLVGPNLFGLFGSKVANKSGFNYSTALASTDVIWNDDNLKSWLRDPNSFAPGTLMVFEGIKDEQRLSYLIDYLKMETLP